MQGFLRTIPEDRQEMPLLSCDVTAVQRQVSDRKEGEETKRRGRKRRGNEGFEGGSEGGGDFLECGRGTRQEYGRLGFGAGQQEKEDTSITHGRKNKEKEFCCFCIIHANRAFEALFYFLNAYKVTVRTYSNINTA
jgi:hypothetical protein